MNSLDRVLAGADTRLPVAARIVVAMLGRLEVGSLRLETPDGESFVVNGAASGPAASLRLADWGVCGDILRGGDVGFADAFVDGRWDSSDLTQLLMLAAHNERALEDAIYGRWWVRGLLRMRHALRANTRRGSRRNIEAHYDLGNEFFALWLDPTMTYSAALFSGDLGQRLDRAQTAKYERILSRLGAGPGDRVLEIGCGWGGFAEHAARTRGCRVHGLTLSPRQLEYARERIARAGLSHLATFELRDYRDAEGSFDHIVSIEMLEAVGEAYWPAYFATVRRLLKGGGCAMIQVITIANELFSRYRAGSDFVQQRVFPGGMLPSPAAFHKHAADAGLVIKDEFAFGLDYAETLGRWGRAFEDHLPEVADMGFDERFLRLWRFYLAYCEAGFRTRRTNVYHFELHRT